MDKLRDEITTNGYSEEWLSKEWWVNTFDNIRFSLYSQ